MTKTLLLCVACFSILASLTSARAKRCMPKSEKPIASEHHKNAVDAFFWGGRIFRQNKLQGAFQKDVGHFCNICNGAILR